MLKAKKGRILISEPSFNDSIFFKSVILLTHHNDNESIGLILNHPTKINLNEILKDIPLSNFPIYIGGPVANKSLQFIHTLGKLIPESKQITENIYFGGDFNIILELIRDKKITKNEIRFFVGYSGWGEDQLNSEIREESWLVDTLKDELCMQYSNSRLWSKIIRNQKSEYAIWVNIPKDPSLN